MDLTELLKSFTGILSIVNPIGAIPIFLGLTSSMNKRERNKTANVAALALVIILLIAAYTGEYLLDFFGVSMASFQVGGGILLLLIAISMLYAKISHARHTPQEAQEAEDMDSVAIVPLAMPIMAGPGSISTVILYAHNFTQISQWLTFSCVITVVGLITWLCLRLAVPIGNKLGQTGINITVRILGLFLAAIAVEFMSNGLKALFPVLK